MITIQDVSTQRAGYVPFTSSVETPENNPEVKIELNQEADEFVPSQDKKKTKKIIGAAALAITAVAGAVVYAKKGLVNLETKKVANSVSGITKKFAQLNEQAQKEHDLVSSILEQAKIDGFTSNDKFRFDLSKPAEAIMEEMNGESDTLARKVIFNSDTLDIAKIHKGFQETAGGGFKTKESITFKEGKLQERLKDHEFSADGSWKTKEGLIIDEVNNVGEWSKQYKNDGKGTWGAKEAFLFKDGEISEWMKDFEESADGTRKVKKWISFEKGGKICEFMKKFKKTADDAWKVKEGFTYSDGQVSTWMKGIEKSQDNGWKAKQRVAFENNKIVEWVKGFEEDTEGNYYYRRGVNFMDGKLNIL